jgi:hypothetical protein
MNSTWIASNIPDQIESYENPHSLRRDASSRKINRILQRRTTRDRSRCGAPKTVQTEQFKKTVKRLVHLKKGPSQRKIVFDLQRKNVPCKKTSIRRSTE